MEEDSGVKAPVTRLRRRLSVEQTEEKVLTPNTPTKKRATRRAKPELDLIDENVVPETLTPKRTTRKAVKDVLEPVEEKAVTPSRRSTRIKSNTSIVSETAALAVDSPRAKRAARRNSHLGSDSEASNTPTLQTRRTRRDSTSSIDKVDAISKPAIIITEPIVEEPETVSRKSTSGNDTTNTSPQSNLRKCPRLNKIPLILITKLEDTSALLNNDTNVNEQKESHNKSTESSSISSTQHINDKSETNKSDNSKSLDSTINLINNIDQINTKTKNIHNKSTSALESNNFKSKKKRTKSWSTVCSPNLKENIFYSDNESKKDKLSSIKLPLRYSMASGDNKLDLNVSKISEICKDVSVTLNKCDINLTVENLNNSKLSSKELFDREPSGIINTEIIIEDSDSNPEKAEPEGNHDNEDQCVPEVSVPDSVNKSLLNPEIQNTSNMANVSHKSEKELNKEGFNDSVEPMDIDETIPDNLLISEPEKTNNSIKNEVTIQQNSIINSHSKSKRKSSISYSPNNTENKSTLIITELKDNSSNEINKSQIATNNKSISKSIMDLDKSQNNETDRKNVSLNCLTSTPLQQKNFQKLLAPINTSIIKSNQDNAKSPVVQNTSHESKSFKNKSKDESSDDDSTEEESSKEKNELLNDEAMDAGDDYESGDSQDEDERQYAEENEIVDKGVTISSEDELSNDSDYEKDSFIVSSDEEDNQLLDGTDDDLSMSDNELKMTAKSKKKYDERMAKQQKKASREMFEARHKLDNSKSKKRISDSKDSSDSSDEEAPVLQKKKNRMRLDSSHDTSTISNENSAKKNKKKRLSESICNESVLNEKEITMQNESLKESDPLEADIKSEPKTPKKDMDSTVDFVDANNANNTIINKSGPNENLSDPLHASMEDELSSSDSDTNNIIDNYDSVLNSLNKNKNPNIGNASLNHEMKTKEKNKKAPVIDDLNLTQVKTVFKNLKPKKSEKESKKEKQMLESSKGGSDSSSDSIDLNLLFSEESNADSFSNKPGNDKDTIPLKKSEAKTNISIQNDQDEADGAVSFFIDTTGERSSEEGKENIDKELNMSVDNDQSLKTSAKKKKKSLSQSMINEATDVPSEETDQSEIQAKTPKSEKKKKKRQSESQVDSTTDIPAEEITQEQNESHAKTPKSEKKKKRHSISHIEQEEPQEQDIIVSNIKTPNSEKKKNKRLSVSVADNLDEAPSEGVTSDINISTLKTPKSEKKMKKRLSESQVDTTTEQGVVIEEVIDVSTQKPNSEKKKKKRMSEAQVNITIDEPATEEGNRSLAKTPKSEKKKKRLSESQIAATEVPQIGEQSYKEDGNISVLKTPKSDKKKKRVSESQPDAVEDIPTEEEPAAKDGNISLSKTPKSEKKKNKRLSESQSQEVADPLEAMPIVEGNVSLLKTPKSDKKKNKRLSESQTDNINTDTPSEEITDLNVSIKTPKSEKKNKNRLSASQTIHVEENSDSDSPLEIGVEMNQPNIEQNDEETKKSSGKKKNKKKGQSKTEIQQETVQVLDDSEGNSNKKRKRPQNSVEEISGDVETSQSKKKRKIMNNEEEILTEPEEGKNIKNKKRKQREDDELGVSKVRKTNALTKMPVPRLPTSILSQLDDKPKEQTKKKPKVVATSGFIVEEVRRSKPSNYLEESIYLHEDSPKKKKPKANIPKPKVLPTMPTASTSNTGYTTNFKVNVIPTETKFVAQKSNIVNFKEERMYNKNIKRLGTYEMYKRQRNIKLSKF
ncbi:dentin sialophosphoprotein [Colias croceus]|uniref:dentin sialophosphoprotein n=1 Tax=Colias crocea TaxID=72248 RepID=UPI001E27EFCE|nr:dentin sialophosphoprotein [Colias croceus]